MKRAAVLLALALLAGCGSGHAKSTPSSAPPSADAVACSRVLADQSAVNAAIQAGDVTSGRTKAADIADAAHTVTNRTLRTAMLGLSATLGDEAAYPLGSSVGLDYAKKALPLAETIGSVCK